MVLGPLLIKISISVPIDTLRPIAKKGIIFVPIGTLRPVRVNPFRSSHFLHNFDQLTLNLNIFTTTGQIIVNNTLFERYNCHLFKNAIFMHIRDLTFDL